MRSSECLFENVYFYWTKLTFVKTPTRKFLYKDFIDSMLTHEAHCHYRKWD